MKRHNFDEMINRRGSDSMKYDALNNFFGVDDVLPMWIADSDFAIPHYIVEAINNRLSHPVLGYTFRNKRFYDALINWVERRGGWRIDPLWVDFSPGIVTGLAFTIDTFTTEGDGVLIQTPVYPPFINCVKQANRTVVENKLINTDGHFTIDFEDFERQAAKAKLFIMCNPHNPVGRVYSEEELRRMGEICIKHNVIMVSDEIHADIIMTPNRHTHIANLSPELANNTITFLAPSKTFNIAGMATAVSVIPNPELKKKYSDRLLRYHVDLSNTFGIEAFIAAYSGGDEWVTDMNDYIKKNIDYLLEYCKKNMPKLVIGRPEATYLMWIDFRPLGVSENELQESLLHHSKIALNRGSDYGTCGDGFMRLNVACPLETVMDGVKRIQVTYDKYTK